MTTFPERYLPFQRIKQLLVGGVALSACLFASTAAAERDDWPKGHYPMPEEGSIVGNIYTVTANADDTLVDIAREHNVGYDEIRFANPDVSIWVPGEGTEVTIPAQHILPDEERTGLVINVAELRLYYYPEVAAGETPRVETYPIGIGRDGYNTPLGITHTRMRLQDPAWYTPRSIREEAAERGDPAPAVVQPGPDNPLGRHAILLDIPGYLIHGTNQPDGIGMRASRGCIRMYPEDIESIFGRIPDGTQVNIIDEAYKLGWDEQGTPHVQSFAPLSEQEGGMNTLLDLIGLVEQHEGGSPRVVDYEQLRDTLERADGLVVPLI